MIAVTALDVCGMSLRNLTLALSKARLNAAIRSTTLSFPSYILLVVACEKSNYFNKRKTIPDSQLGDITGSDYAFSVAASESGN